MTIKQQGGIFGRNPTFNDLTVEGSVSVPADSISGDAINGGTPTPTSLAVNTATALDRIHAYDASQTTDQLATQLLLQNETGQAATAGVGFQVSAFGEGPTGTYAPKAGILFERNAANGGGVLKFYNDGSGDTTGFALADLRMEILNSGNVNITNGNLVMATSGTGIDFSATAGTGTSELFDDYEEGAWTPVVTSSVGTITTVGTVQGFYTKIGNFVFVWGTVQVTDIGTGSGALLVGGLPFTCLSTTQSGSGCIGSGYNTSSAVISLVRITGNSTTAQIRRYDGAFPLGSGQTIGFSGNYYV